jgi:hypothetical protein
MELFGKSFSPTEKFIRHWIDGVLDDAGVAMTTRVTELADKT